MRRSKTWSQRSTQAIIKSSSARAVSHTIISAILAFGVVNVSIRDSKKIKKIKVVGVTKRKTPGDVASAIPKGTTADQYVQFISDTLYTMD